MPPDYASALIVLAIAWAIGALSRSAVRQALMNGLRCMTRYPDLWRIPALFGLGYAIFQLAASGLFQFRLHEMPAAIAWGPSPPLETLATAGLLPAAERTTAVFNVFIATFPLSAWFALLFLCNTGGLFAELWKAIRKRFGNTKAAGLVVLLVLTAIAAILKPAVYLLLPEITDWMPIFASLAVNALSGAFELLLGIFFLTYLMLVTLAWLRGVHFYPDKLRLMAMRRTGYVLKWSFVMVGLSALLILAPIYAGLLVAPGETFYRQCEWFSNWIGRPIVTAIALFYCPVQAILVFHNESLRRALRDARILMRQYGATILPFLIAAYTAFLALEIACGYARERLGTETFAGLGVLTGASLIEALLAGWLIASWVCLYKSLSAVRKEIPF